MALIETDLFGTTDKVQNSIDVLRSFEPKEGYYVAFSGGKDSVVIKKLCDLAGVKYDAHYSVTSVDPPELVQFIKEQYPDVSRDIPHYSDGTPITMWNLIPKKLMPPTRIARYCCQELKETGGYGRLVITGVRWAESDKRKKNRGLINIGDKATGKILNNDNDEARELLESCYQKKKTVINPIINWEDEDVWEFIHKYNVPYCKLYDEGYTRLGCIGCPMNTKSIQELERYPTYKRAYIRAFEKMIQARVDRGLHTPVGWTTGEGVMEWWLSDRQKKDEALDGQIELDLEVAE
jgi:phosphoadenosine phosphosulfate reductase